METHLATKTSEYTFCGLICSEKIRYLRSGEKGTIRKFCEKCIDLSKNITLKINYVECK